MLPLLPLPPSLMLFAFAAAVGAASLRWLHPLLWRSRLARCLGAGLLACGLAGHLLWAGIGYPGLGVRLAWTTNVLLVPVALALLCGGLAGQAQVRGTDRAPPGGPEVRRVVQRDRRAVVQAVAALPAAVALGASARGLLAANSPPRLPVVRLTFPDLHPDLEGLRILHLSDLHLGTARHVRDLEALFARAAPLRPDLVVLTGDVADDLQQLARALDVVHAHRGRHGAFASLGNHEYLHGIEATLPIFRRSPVPLLLDGGVALTVGNAGLWIAGADDPVAEHAPPGFLRTTVARCAAGAPAAAFRLLLSHRPAAFPVAAAHGFDLTLSGHTHGGQLGVAGRSLVEGAMPYAWGSYARGARRLYTSAGFGHWFPFRLGCPSEAPLLVLTRGADGAAA